MKKLIIIAAVALTAALTQAATVSWSMNGIVDSEGNAMSGGAAYIFCTKGTSATTIDAVTAALAGLTSPSAVKSWLEANSLTALSSTVSGGSAGASGVDIEDSGVPAATPSVKLFAVVVDDALFGDATQYVVTTASGNVKTPAANTSNNAGFSISSAAMADSSNWKPANPSGPVPEPTSGILMLVGLGALALRRRRA